VFSLDLDSNLDKNRWYFYIWYWFLFIEIWTVKNIWHPQKASYKATKFKKIWIYLHLLQNFHPNPIPVQFVIAFLDLSKKHSSHKKNPRSNLSASAIAINKGKKKNPPKTFPRIQDNIFVRTFYDTRMR